MIPQCDPHANYIAHRGAIDAAIARVLSGQRYVLGPEVAGFEAEFAAAMGASWAVGVANGTDAVELALRAVGVTAQDSVATVSHGAIATVSAIARLGARPLFVDVDPRRCTMSPESLKAMLHSPAGGSVRAVVIVHLYGQPADMTGLMDQVRERGIPVVEDCAQAHGAKLHGRPVGTWGALGCFSFYPTKNLGAIGDGGAVIGRDPALETTLRLLREYGWRERHVSETFGANSRLDELQPAILRAKLPHLRAENQRRRIIAGHYNDLLADCTLTLPLLVPASDPVYHQYVVSVHERDRLQASLLEAGVTTLVHYPRPIHKQPAYADPECCPIPLPDTESLARRVISLPMFPELSDSDVAAVARRVRRCLAMHDQRDPSSD
ncbi:MAG: DegT/DnrJ/EryC1/StrS family aminotransferase [Cyanobium sp.]